MFSGNIKLGSFGEYEIKAIKRSIPKTQTRILESSINFLIAKNNTVLPSFFISILDGGLRSWLINNSREYKPNFYTRGNLDKVKINQIINSIIPNSSILNDYQC